MSLKINEIKEIFSETPIEEIPDKINIFKNDERSGVAKLVEKYEKKYNAYLEEIKRLEEISVFEKELIKNGYQSYMRNRRSRKRTFGRACCYCCGNIA